MNVFKRVDGRYEGRIPRGKKQNGKRKFQYIIVRTKEEVISRILNIRKKEEPCNNCSKSMEVVFNEWFKSIQYQVKESTAANYKMKADKHILPYFGEKPIDSIVQDDIYAFIANRREKELSDRYITDIIILMKVIFKFAIKTYNIPNPMIDLALPKRKNPAS